MGMEKLTQTGLLMIDKKRRKVVSIQQIVMLKGCSNYTYFYLKNGKYRMSSHTLKYYETELVTKGFLRVHRGSIINPDCIVRYDVKNAHLLLLNGYEVEVSRRKKKLLVS